MPRLTVPTISCVVFLCLFLIFFSLAGKALSPTFCPSCSFSLRVCVCVCLRLLRLCHQHQQSSTQLRSHYTFSSSCVSDSSSFSSAAAAVVYHRFFFIFGLEQQVERKKEVAKKRERKKEEGNCQRRVALLSLWKEGSKGGRKRGSNAAVVVVQVIPAVLHSLPEKKILHYYGGCIPCLPPVGTHTHTLYCITGCLIYRKKGAFSPFAPPHHVVAVTVSLSMWTFL